MSINNSDDFEDESPEPTTTEEPTEPTTTTNTTDTTDTASTTSVSDNARARKDADAMPNQLSGTFANVVALGSLFVVYCLLFLAWYKIFNDNSVYYMMRDWMPVLVAVTVVACFSPLQYVWGPNVANRLMDKYL